MPVFQQIGDNFERAYVKGFYVGNVTYLQGRWLAQRPGNTSYEPISFVDKVLAAKHLAEGKI
ncbi:hypothetical protein [Aerosakkonema funiforme]|uniref:hypothetical protein n=1 Tax=Aerosakkonema funiforme TaxID=1246630 RepID=UPI0035B7233C